MAGQLVTAGAAAGTAVMPGIGTAVGAIGGALLEGFMNDGNSMASQGPAGSSSASVAVYGSGLSGDGWNVNFGGSPVNTSTFDKPFSATGPTASTAAEGGAVMPSLPGVPGVGNLGQSFYGLPLWAWIAAGGLIAWKALRSKK